MSKRSTAAIRSAGDVPDICCLYPWRLKKAGERIPAKLVFVRNKSKRKDWLVLVSTDTAISEEEIIRIYGKRWDIEVFFQILQILSEAGKRIPWDLI